MEATPCADPRRRGRGPIEAVSAYLCSPARAAIRGDGVAARLKQPSAAAGDAKARGDPRRRGRGPIEARRCTAPAKPPTPIRDDVVAAQLKRLPRHVRERPSRPAIRDDVVAAQLKP